jgi:hypothetical protein
MNSCLCSGDWLISQVISPSTSEVFFAAPAGAGWSKMVPRDADLSWPEPAGLLEFD